MRRQNWRSIEDWKAQGLDITTSSNEAVKLYDAAISQVVGWYNDPLFDGLPGTLEKMLKAEPDFALGKTLSVGLELIGTGNSVLVDEQLRKEVESLSKQLGNENKLNNRERKHIEAIIKFANGSMRHAADIWEEILIEYPMDLQALKFAHDAYFYLGRHEQMRDSVARVLPIWDEKKLPLKSYVHGMYAFGLEETNLYRKAEKEATIALEENIHDGWATHALAHVLEMEGRTKEGISTMSTTAHNWDSCDYVACHNYWHWALYHIELGEYDAVVDLFDTQIARRALQSKTMLDVVDMTSLLYRLELIDPSLLPKSAWDKAYSIVEPHLHDHILAFNDAHFMMASLAVKKTSVETLLETCQERDTCDNKIRLEILKAMVAYNEERYNEAVELLLPIRYDLINIGGSHAQRDVFQQLLFLAALKSSKHKELAVSLFHQRQQLKDSKLTCRLLKEHGKNLGIEI